ncbi:ketopantoate hydroxymethyltransferase, partial [Mesorhizobium sp. M7D.F.Ca.US.004.03.1.1]
LQKAVRDARVEALSGFRNEVASGSYPANAEVAGIAQAELDDFRERLETERD